MKLRTRKIPPSPGQSRNPFELWMMVSFLAWSIGIAAFGPPAAGVTLSMSDPARYAVALVMGLGSIMCFIGIFLPDVIMSAFVELGGLIGIQGPLAIYVANLASNVHDIRAALQVGAIAFLLVCCGHRAWDIGTWIRYIKNAKIRTPANDDEATPQETPGL